MRVAGESATEQCRKHEYGKIDLRYGDSKTCWMIVGARRDGSWSAGVFVDGGDRGSSLNDSLHDIAWTARSESRRVEACHAKPCEAFLSMSRMDLDFIPWTWLKIFKIIPGMGSSPIYSASLKP